MKNFTITSLACTCLCFVPVTANAKKLDKKDKELAIGLASVLISGILSNKQNQQQAKQSQQNQQQNIANNQEKEKFVRQIYEDTLGLWLERKIDMDIGTMLGVKEHELQTTAALNPKYMSRALQSADYIHFKYSQAINELDDCTESGFDLFLGFQDSIPYHPNHKIDYTTQDDGTVKVSIKIYSQWDNSYHLQDVIYHLVQEDGQYKVDDIGYFDHTHQLRIASIKSDILKYCS